MKKRIVSIVLTFLMLAFVPATNVSADAPAKTQEEVLGDTPYLALGADLKESEEDTVLNLLDVSKEELDSYQVVKVTNDEEHEYLGKYLPDSVIGRRALSSVLVKKAKEDTGISVKTYNISYCTDMMYCNALITAGIEDADVVVAGPFKLTGTAALVGTIKAYAEMTGTEVSQDNIDAATNELVVTGELGEQLSDQLGDDAESKEKAGELMALVKQKVVEDGLTNKDDIIEATNDACKDLELSLSEDQKAEIASVMGKVSDLDLNVDSMKEQAKSLYDKLSELDLPNLDIDLGSKGFWDKVGDFFQEIGEKIASFFEGLF